MSGKETRGEQRREGSEENTKEKGEKEVRKEKEEEKKRYFALLLLTRRHPLQSQEWPRRDFTSPYFLLFFILFFLISSLISWLLDLVFFFFLSSSPLFGSFLSHFSFFSVIFHRIFRLILCLVLSYSLHSFISSLSFFFSSFHPFPKVFFFTPTSPPLCLFPLFILP